MPDYICIRIKGRDDEWLDLNTIPVVRPPERSVFNTSPFNATFMGTKLIETNEVATREDGARARVFIPESEVAKTPHGDFPLPFPTDWTVEQALEAMLDHFGQGIFSPEKTAIIDKAQAALNKSKIQIEEPPTESGDVCATCGAPIDHNEPCITCDKCRTSNT